MYVRITIRIRTYQGTTIIRRIAIIVRRHRRLPQGVIIGVDNVKQI